MVGIGILGAAMVAPYAMIKPVSARDDCHIVAVGCRDAGRGKAFANLHGIPNVETDYFDLVNRPDVDLVYNALPPSRHADLSIAALEAGKAVLCEKPFAMNAGEAAQMVAVAKRTGGILIEAFHYRYHPAIDRLIEKLRSGEIGRIIEFNAIFVAPVPFKLGEVRHTLSIGGGTLMDMGCYPVHWARTVFGTEPTVKNATALVSQPNIDMTMNAELSFANGGFASLECSMDASRPFQAELTVKGTKGEIHMENPLMPQTGHAIRTEIDGSISTETVEGGSTYDLQLAHVLNVMKGDANSLLDGNDAVANMTVIDNIYRAAGMNPR